MKYIKPKEIKGSDNDEQQPKSLLLILKWGGELTTAGAIFYFFTFKLIYSFLSIYKFCFSAFLFC